MSLVNIDIDLLRTLIVVADTGNFTKAGERLLRTQSAISLQIKRLEEFVGERLVNRENDMQLTAAGEMVRSYAIDILNLNDQLVSSLETASNNRVIKIGTPDDYAQLFLPSVIREYSKINGNVEFQVISDLSINLARMVQDGEIDLALITRTGDMHGINLTAEPLCWVAKYGYEPDNDPIPLALFPEGCEVRRLATSSLNKSGLKWNIVCSSNQLAPIFAMISTGSAIGVLPSRAVPKDFIRIGNEFGLPHLPNADLLLKLAPQADALTQNVGKAIAHSFGPH
ncbi:LysR family transcriptional regulator [Tateyamaria omphalii]|uniref:LysR substrate-binding domain-containing protein n=1 Tax=Tateyamaria omphalii TaxID=299262 RepID=UPI0016721EEA|nr:LysR family transcriptional regulator [Tateyamaria omphalii]GGX65275.1 LysR family transcriptional regulator [Tateyamaria omphalii]